jgi:pilus assembly protein CpaD
MKNPLTLLVVPAMLALAACQPGAAEYTDNESPKQVRVDSAATPLGLAFAAGSDQLARGEAARLDRLALAGRIRPEDRVTVSAAGDPFLQRRRVEAIAAELLRFGVVATASPLAGVPRDRAILVVGRHLVTLPACPNWSKAPRGDFDNTVSSNFGCATASNLGLMVASPADLVDGRELGPTDGRIAAAAVQRYVGDTEKIPQQFDGAGASPGSTVGATIGSTGGGK